MSLFSVTGLSKRFGRRQVVSGVNLQVAAGEVVGLLKPEAGTIIFRDRDITKLPMDARARLGMGYLAQEPTVFAQLSVADNVRIVLEQHYPKSEQDTRLASLLEELHLTHLAKNLARSLSGGERRRLEITRALVVEPKLLFFDEPFAGVDPRSRSDITGVTAELKRRGVAVLITDHHAEAILGMVDRLYVMDAGTIMAEGTPQEIVDNADVRRAYLGDDFTL